MLSDHFVNGQNAVHPFTLPRLMPQLPPGSSSHNQYRFPMIPSYTHQSALQMQNSYAPPMPLSLPNQKEIAPKTLSTEESTIKMELENSELWERFDNIGTEMIVTKPGRRMFPSIKLRCLGMDPAAKYVLLVDVVPVDKCKYKYTNSEWSATGTGEPHIHNRLYIHPDSPAPGSHWMKKTVSFHKLKITNNNMDRNGHIILNTMQKYQPRIHVVRANDVNILHWGQFDTTTFPETKFIPVTAYQSEQITQLKVDNNPFAKGFRDNRRTCFGGKRHRLEDDDPDYNSVEHPKAKRPNVQDTPTEEMIKFDDLCRAYVLPHATSFSLDNRADCASSPDLVDSPESLPKQQLESNNEPSQLDTVCEMKSESASECNKETFAYGAVPYGYPIENSEELSLNPGLNVKQHQQEEVPQFRNDQQVDREQQSQEFYSRDNGVERTQQQTDVKKAIHHDSIEVVPKSPVSSVLSFYEENYYPSLGTDFKSYSLGAEADISHSRFQESKMKLKGISESMPQAMSLRLPNVPSGTYIDNVPVPGIPSSVSEDKLTEKRTDLPLPIENESIKKETPHPLQPLHLTAQPSYNFDFCIPFTNQMSRNTPHFYGNGLLDSEKFQSNARVPFLEPSLFATRFDAMTRSTFRESSLPVADKSKSPESIHRIDNILKSEAQNTPASPAARTANTEHQRKMNDDINVRTPPTASDSNEAYVNSLYRHPVFTFGDAMLWGDMKTNF